MRGMGNDATTLPAVADDLHSLDWPRLGDYMRRRRQDMGMTQAELASASGVSVGTVQNFEKGRAPTEWPRTLYRIIECLGWAPRSEETILTGGEPTIRTHDTRETDLVWILKHVSLAGPRTLHAMRAVLESDIGQDPASSPR